MASSALVVTPAAERDLVEIAIYLRGEGEGLDARFLREAQSAFERIADHPFIGPEVVLDAPNPGLRRWQLPKLRSYLIFYRVGGDAVLIVRVLHGSRDLDLALEGS